MSIQQTTADQSITSVNSTLIITASNPFITSTIGGISSVVTDITNIGADILGFPIKFDLLTSEDAIQTDPQTVNDYMVALTGELAIGYLARATLAVVTANVLANSKTLYYINKCVDIMAAQREALRFSGILNMPSIRTKYNLTAGALLQTKQIPDHGAMLRPVAMKFVFNYSKTSLIG